MNIGFTLLVLLLQQISTVPQQVPKGPDFTVVGVYRPVELSGRTVTQSREVYLQAERTDMDLNTLVGRTLAIHRKSRVPASIGMVGKEIDEIELAEIERKADETAWSEGSGTDSSETSRPGLGLKRSRLSLQPSGSLPPPGNGRPSAFGTPRTESVNLNFAYSLGGTGPARDKIERPQAPGVPTGTISLKIGRVQITSIRDDVVVAKVIIDGLQSDKKNKTMPVSGESIMAGDMARLEKKKLKRPKSQKLSKKLQKQLGQERGAFEKEAARRARKPVKYRRKKMRWDL